MTETRDLSADGKVVVIEETEEGEVLGTKESGVQSLCRPSMYVNRYPVSGKITFL